VTGVLEFTEVREGDVYRMAGVDGSLDDPAVVIAGHPQKPGDFRIQFDLHVGATGNLGLDEGSHLLQEGGAVVQEGREYPSGTEIVQAARGVVLLTGPIFAQPDCDDEL